ncbi:putative Magnesium transporter [Seiridium cardinale]
MAPKPARRLSISTKSRPAAPNRPADLALFAGPAVFDGRYIGVPLALCSSVAIGFSYVTTKVGPKDAAERHGFSGNGYEYFRNPTWWTAVLVARKLGGVMCLDGSVLIVANAPPDKMVESIGEILELAG